MKTKDSEIGSAELSETIALLQQGISNFAAMLAGVTVHAEETTKRADAIRLPAKAKAKPKAKLHPHAHNGVKLTVWQWTVWVAVKALFDSKKELTEDSKGFYSLSCLFYTSPSPRDLPTSRLPSSPLKQHRLRHPSHRLSS